MPPQGTQSSRAWNITLFGDDTQLKEWVARINYSTVQYPSRYQYILVGGPELTSAGVKHVHIYVEFKNQLREAGAKKLLFLTDHNVYCTRESKLTRNDVIQHHKKQRSKCDPDVLVLLEYPTPSESVTTTVSDDTNPRPTKKAKNEKAAHVLQLAEQGQIDQIKDLYPGDYLRLRTNILTIANERQVEVDNTLLQHYWIYGPEQTGKTQSVRHLFPNAYIKDPSHEWWDGYDKHKQVLLSDLDNRTLRAFGVQRLKTLCDATGIPGNIKNSAPKMIKAQVIVTSNYSIDECFQYLGKNKSFNEEWYSDIDKRAIKERFMEVSIHQWLFMNNLKLKSAEELRALKGTNIQPGDCFHHGNYVQDASECYVSNCMDKLSDQLYATNTQLVQSGYIKQNPFPKTRFDYCESTEHQQVWRSDQYTLVITRLPDPLADGSDAIEVDWHNKTPDNSDIEDN